MLELGVIIREALPDDAGAVANVHVTTWQHAYAGIFPQEKLAELDQNLVRSEERWRANLSNKENYPAFFIAETVGGEVVGFAGAGEQANEQYPYDAELYLIYILPDYQRLGIGRQLFKAVAEKLGSAGFTSLMLWVLKQNEQSRAFYLNLGGKVVGESDYLRWDVNYEIVAYGWDDLTTISAPDERVN